MRSSNTFSGAKSPLSPKGILNFSVSSVGSPSKSGFSSNKSSNIGSFSTALH